MSAIPGICTQAKLAFLKSMEDDEFYMSLYGEGADINPHTESYTSDGEVSGPGYTAGGIRLEGIKFGVTGSRAWIDWDDPKWDVATIDASAAMIYNRTKNNLAICVLVFERTRSSNAPWWLELPPPGETAVFRWA